MPRLGPDGSQWHRVPIHVSVRFTQVGDVAQLGERSVRNAEVVGSIPIVSIFSSLISARTHKRI